MDAKPGMARSTGGGMPPGRFKGFQVPIDGMIVQRGAERAASRPLIRPLRLGKFE